ncbi:MAG: electron transfer flavoprotein subunit alpha/FixB family protein, partial [Pseudomonadota bacterium]|nr:electron transfer flavoprotein subunit alpha/FixB family protein [Pseudomonadota bacterium]
MSTLVIAEHENSSLKKSTLNTITAASAVGEPVDV